MSTRPARDVAEPGPDFVCIGAQKAGTTWIHDCLNDHPDVWLPPTKELHYFDSACPNQELLGIEAYPHAGIVERYLTLRHRPTPRTLRWVWRFGRREGTADWYRALFADGKEKGRRCGELTPAYSTLDERGVRFARRVLHSDCRIFLVIRHPAERTWSSLKMYYRWSEKDIGRVSPETATAFARQPGNRLRTDYARMVRLWREGFGEHFRVFLYDDLVDSPSAFINEVCAFIGISSIAGEEIPRERSNADPERRHMPRGVREALDEIFEGAIEDLAGLVPEVAVRWLR